jgi:hypothetical protein
VAWVMDRRFFSEAAMAKIREQLLNGQLLIAIMET